MTSFIETESGWINADHVTHIVLRCPKDGAPYCLLYDREGRQLGGQAFGFDPEIDAGTIVPAAPGARAVLIYRATATEPAWSTEVAIVAWRIAPGDFARPILADTPYDATVLIRNPDGTLIWPGNAVFEGLEQAMKDLG